MERLFYFKLALPAGSQPNSLREVAVSVYCGSNVFDGGEAELGRVCLRPSATPSSRLNLEVTLLPGLQQLLSALEKIRRPPTTCAWRPWPARL